MVTFEEQAQAAFAQRNGIVCPECGALLLEESHSRRCGIGRENVQPVGIVSLAESLGIDPDALVNACETASPSKSLRHLADAETAVEKLREYAVARLRADHQTWAYIGRRLGTTPQAAHKRFRHLEK